MNMNDDRSFFKYLTIVTAILFALMLISIFLANLVGGSSEEDMAEVKRKNDETLLANVGKPLNFHEPVIATAGMSTASSGESQSGDAVYTGNCAACHDSGAAGAPKLETAAWESRVSKGFDTLSDHAINGFNAMPAKGGGNISDDETRKAVAYMLEQAGFPDVAPDMGSDDASGDASMSESSSSTESSTQSTSSENTSDESSDSSANASASQHPLLASADMSNGESLYGPKCSVCHNSGAAGAPKLEADAWTARVDKGFETLLNNAVNGYNAMPAKGGHPDLSDQDIADTIVYMVDQAGLSLTADKASGDDSSDNSDHAESDSSSSEASSQSTSSTSNTENSDSSDSESQSSTSSNETMNTTAEAAVVEVATPADTSAEHLAHGEEIFNKGCSICHNNGVAGAPKLGDKEAWAPRLSTGYASLQNTILNGKGAMPARGAIPQSVAADEDLFAALDYIISQAQ